ncbi:multicopper oxidase [Colletotrichum falcatum]|nr:multicopper oxidase [Colletotrichum falcatum]
MRSTLSQNLLFLLYGLAVAAPPNSGVAKRQDEPADNPDDNQGLKSCNTPSNRQCWVDGFDINTAYEEKTPDTGVTREYTLVLTEPPTYKGADGVDKNNAMLINGGFPGPTIKADWGDKISVRVVNNLRTNGTSIHWHGVRQLNNNINDGVNGITECPIPPGSSKTYEWRAEQYGSSWYHSHFSDQYANGIVGAIQIDGPTSKNYDEDLGIYPITDWYYKSADEIRSTFTAPAAVPASDNILFNGTNVNKNGGGTYSRVTLKKGKVHKIRLVNMSVDNTFSVALVNHKMTVTGTDFVPVKPFETDSLYLSVGQRYDVLINADQDPSKAYWFNVSFPSNRLCGTSNINKPAAIFQYEGSSGGLMPKDAGQAAVDAQCQDKTDFEPVYSVNVDSTAFQKTQDDTLDITVDTSRTTNQQRVYWKVNGQNMDVDWDEPTLSYLAKNDSDYPAQFNVFEVPDSNTWAFWVVENLFPAPHPMHIHGHDFYVLGHSDPTAGVGNGNRFNPQTDTSKLNFKNPTRRDVTMLPGRGWLVVAFKTDNPGAWLFHCHIAWHVSQGLSVQFLERKSDILGTVKVKDMDDMCSQWNSYSKNAQYKQSDSGI